MKVRLSKVDRVGRASKRQEEAHFREVEHLDSKGKNVVQLHWRSTGVTKIARLTSLSYPPVRKAFRVDVIRRVDVLARKAIKVPDAELDEVLGAGGACTRPSAASSRGSA